LKTLKINSNRIFCLSLVFCLLVSFSANAQEKESADIHKTRSSAIINGLKYYLHTVEKGQTLFAISKFYKCDVNDIVIDNPEAIDGIKPGQILKILINKKPAELSANDTGHFILHKVEKGQTLYSITKQYGVSQEKIKVLNPELKDGLKVNQFIKIPSLKTKKDSVITDQNVKPVIAALANSSNENTINTADAADRSSLGYKNYKGEKKEEYTIAFFLPFHADEANAIELEKIIKGDAQFSTKTNVALQFYEGAILAIDSLKKQNLDAKIFFYDVDEKDSLSMIAMLKKPELASMDLIIGPLYGSSFMPIANFAKEHEIAIVSPFTQVNKILFNNPYVSKVSPSITLHVEQMAHFVVDTFKTQNIILINNSNTKEISFFNAFRNTANADLLKAGVLPSDTVKIASGRSNMQSMLSASKLNIIILPSNNQSYVTEFISHLNSINREKFKIVLFGLQNWMNYDNLDFEYLNNLSLHIPANTFVDYKNASTQNFIQTYRSKYKTEPEMYVYQGFDVAYCFISLLQKEGSGFLKQLSANKYSGISSNYQFAQFPSESGFENKFVYILKYKDYQLIKAN
jgi:LysM repeat protein/ABC-type branched-subunit amino acid transport system substrate-binding protein